MHLESGLLGLSQDLPLRPWEMKTLRIETAKTGKVRAVAVSALEV